MATLLQIPTSTSWSSLQQTNLTNAKLQLLCHSAKELHKEGYVTTGLTDRVVWSKMRCKNCNSRLKHYRPSVCNENTRGVMPWSLEESGSSENPPRRLPSFQDVHAQEVARAAALVEKSTAKKHACVFHDGKVVRGIWSCCGGRPNTSGCCSHPRHEPNSEKGLKENWIYYKTPPASIAVQPERPLAEKQRRCRSQLTYPRNDNSGNDIRAVVALDCEMGTAANGDSELIRLTLIDCFTTEILIDQLVKPSVHMAHYNTRYSGVTFGVMNAAVRSRTCFFGRDAARKRVFNFVGPTTIVLMHGGSSDLNALRWIHPNVVDTFILESYDFDAAKGRSLKALAAKKLSLEIQNARRQDGRLLGHDSLEDAMATRELVIWWLNIIPNN